MISILKETGNKTFYLIMVSSFLFFIFGCYYIIINRYIFTEILVFISACSYPLSLIWEERHARILIKREKKDASDGRLHTIISGEDVKLMEGMYSLYSLVISIIINGAILFFRLIYPGYFRINTIVFSLIVFIIGILIYRKRSASN